MPPDPAVIFYEIALAPRAHDNVVVGNGVAPTAAAWGAQAGISHSSSPRCFIERSLVVGNREGFKFREQTRSTPTIEDRTSRPVWNHDQLIRHNVTAFNCDVHLNRLIPPGREVRHSPGEDRNPECRESCPVARSA